MTETYRLLEKLFVLLSGDDTTSDVVEEEIRQATQELESALAALHAARGRWSGAQTVDLAAVKRALDLAERQLDAARVRLEKANRARKG